MRVFPTSTARLRTSDRLKKVGALAKSFQTQVAKGVKVEKVSASLGDTLRTRLERVRGVSPVLRSGG